MLEIQKTKTVSDFEKLVSSGEDRFFSSMISAKIEVCISCLELRKQFLAQSEGTKKDSSDY